MAAERPPSMSNADLADLAATRPVHGLGAAQPAVDVVQEGPEHTPTAPCHHVYRYRPCWAVDGCRRLEPIGPTFATPREAHAFLRRLTEAEPVPLAVAEGRDPSPLPGPLTQLRLALDEANPAQT